MSLKLKIESSCEIDDLIDSLMFASQKSYDEVETILFKEGIYPESKKTYITNQFGNILSEVNESNKWLEDALGVILSENNINGLYITIAI